MSASLFVFFILLAAKLSCTEPSAEQIAERELGIVEMKLSNGMRICLKATHFDEDEVLIRLTARGGYAALPPAQRAAGELAAQVAWESGLEGVSTDKLIANLYDHSMELYAKVMPYHRIIEGTTEVDGIECFFDLAKRYSAQKHFTREGFQKVIAINREFLQGRDKARLCPFEEWSRLVHTQEVEALRPLSQKDLESMQFDQSKQFFEEYFSNPAEFVCVVVGNFEVEKIIPLVKSQLGAIAFTSSSTAVSAPPPQFPEGIRVKAIPAPHATESLAALTFPLPPIRDPQQLRMAKLMAQLLENRLRLKSPCYSASLALPLYPGLYLTWLSLQYCCSPDAVMLFKDQILEEMRRIAVQGVTEKEIASSWKLLRLKEDLWQHDNGYWLSLLSDHFLRGWEWQELQKTVEMGEPPTVEKFMESFKQFLKLDHYSFIYTETK